MVKGLFVLLISFICVVNANATQIPINFTGNMVAKAHDTTLQANYWQTLGLGGPVGNQFIEYKAYEFTVDDWYMANYLEVNAVAIPNYFSYLHQRSEYTFQRFAEGASVEQVTYEIEGDENSLPVFRGSPQSIEVFFNLIEGTIPYRPETTNDAVQPSNHQIGSAAYRFFTEDSLFNTEYPGILIPLQPFSVELVPDKTYWIAAADPDFSGVTLNYSTQLQGRHVVPEPATALLFGVSLAGSAVLRRRFNHRA